MDKVELKSQFYHLKADPHELTNLAGDAAHEAQRRKLADRLDRWMARTKDPFAQLTVTDRAGYVIPLDAGTSQRPATTQPRP